ncbi:MAG: mercury resistance system transport protein MerF [Chloroflexota bacterium]
MQNLKKFGIVGTVIAGFLCFTPLLALVFGAFGVSWASGYLDYVLIPVMILFVAMTIYAYIHGRKKLDVH